MKKTRPDKFINTGDEMTVVYDPGSNNPEIHPRWKDSGGQIFRKEEDVDPGESFSGNIIIIKKGETLEEAEKRHNNEVNA